MSSKANNRIAQILLSCVWLIILIEFTSPVSQRSVRTRDCFGTSPLVVVMSCRKNVRKTAPLLKGIRLQSNSELFLDQLTIVVGSLVARHPQ